MRTHCGPRLHRRYRRPVPLPASRSQIRQKIEHLRTLYQLEAFLELNKLDPNVEHLDQLDNEAGFLSEVLSSLEEQI
jgi:hypothetical protein